MKQQQQQQQPYTAIVLIGKLGSRHPQLRAEEFLTEQSFAARMPILMTEYVYWEEHTSQLCYRHYLQENWQLMN